MTSVADLLREQKANILGDWAERVRKAPDVPIARQLSRPALVDHLPDLIDDLVRCLQESDPEELADRVACGRELGRSRAAEAHAAHRTAEGYSVRQALLELSMFRLVLLDVVARATDEVPLADMMIVHAAIDEAMRTCAHEMQQVNLSGALAESNARKEILRVVSHDMRTPLSTVLFAAERLAANSDPEVIRKASVIARNGHRLRRLIDDLGDVNAMESGSLSVTPTPEKVVELLNEAVATHREQADKKSITVSCEANVGLVVQADVQRVLQVLGNLIGNAIEVLGPGGHIWLTATEHGEEVIIGVRDDGPGIDADHQSLVFDRFWRAPSARYAGSGLGLAISRGIVEALGGRIWVESSPGKGAAFYFTLQISQLIRTAPSAC